MIFSDIAQLVGGLMGAYGSKVNVPALTPVSADQQQQAAIAGNLTVLPQAEKLATSVNQFSLDQIKTLMNQLAPGYTDTLALGTRNATALMRGELPQDVLRSVADKSNAAATFGGYGGSGLAHNLSLRDLGISELQAQQMGLRQFQTLLADSESLMPHLYDFSTAFMTTGQRVALAVQQQSAQYTRDLQKAQADAAPDPSLVATIHAAGALGDDVASLAAGGIGGMVGGLGGGSGVQAGANPQVAGLGGAGGGGGLYLTGGGLTGGANSQTVIGGLSAFGGW